MGGAMKKFHEILSIVYFGIGALLATTGFASYVSAPSSGPSNLCTREWGFSEQ